MTRRNLRVMRLFTLGSAFITLHAGAYAGSTKICPDIQRANYAVNRDSIQKTEYWIVDSPQAKKSKGAIHAYQTIINLHNKYVRENSPSFVCKGKYPHAYETCLTSDGRSFNFFPNPPWDRYDLAIIPNKSGGVHYCQVQSIISSSWVMEC